MLKCRTCEDMDIPYAHTNTPKKVSAVSGVACRALGIPRKRAASKDTLTAHALHGVSVSIMQLLVSALCSNLDERIVSCDGRSAGMSTVDVGGVGGNNRAKVLDEQISADAHNNRHMPSAGMSNGGDSQQRSSHAPV